MNPFITNTYRGPEYFIDRKGETALLIDAVKNDRNLTLFSHRRLGKTMLLHHTFSLLAQPTVHMIDQFPEFVASASGEGGPQANNRTQMLLKTAPGFDRSETVGFRCVCDK